MFGRIWLREIPERFLRGKDGIFPGKVWYPAVSAPGTIFLSISAYLVPCCRHPLGRVQSYTPSLLPRQNTTYARTTSKKLAAFIFLSRGAVVRIGLPCVTRPAGLALLRLCAALRLVNPPLRVPFLPLAKNEACQGFVSCRCQAELHTLQRCCNVLHTATAVLH